VFSKDTRAPLSLLWRSLTFNPVLSKTTYAVLALILATWIVAMLFAVSEMARSGAFNEIKQWSKAGETVAAISIVLALVFGVGLCIQVGGLPYIPTPVTDAQRTLALAGQLVGITNYYLYSVFLLALLAAIALSLEAGGRLPMWGSRWGWVALVPMIVATLVWINVLNLNSIRADVYYKVGRFFEDQNEWEASIPLFSRGIQLAPMVDAYPMALGRVLKYRANASKPEPASRFNDQARLQDILSLDVQQMAGMSRLDFLYAAQTMLLHARDLNPLYPEHTLNLARFYVPETPIDSDAKMKLAELASRYYAEAIRLSPGNVLLWNEWAVLDLDRQDPDAALVKLDESLRRDPHYGPTYVSLAKVYAAQDDLERAAQAYRQALALQPDLAEAQSGLAFAYYQQGQLAQAAQAYSRYIELSPQASNVWEAHKNLALIYKQMGDLTQAFDEAQLAASLAPSEFTQQMADWAAQMNVPQPPASPAAP
jgi:tetratricopeptide (TPR) repeat protein